MCTKKIRNTMSLDDVWSIRPFMNEGTDACANGYRRGISGLPTKNNHNEYQANINKEYRFHYALLVLLIHLFCDEVHRKYSPHHINVLNISHTNSLIHLQAAFKSGVNAFNLPSLDIAFCNNFFLL